MRWLTPLALSVAAACAQPSAVPASPPGARAEPDIRVGVTVGVAEVAVGGSGSVVAYSHGEAVLQGNTRMSVDGRALRTDRGERFERLTFLNQSPGRFVTVGDRAYRGAIEVFNRDGALTVVNELKLEDYLAGVVAVEMGSRTERERAALEAQAIVARTYALKNMGKFRTAGFDLRAGVSDQAYGGQRAETPLAREAVRSTAGQVLTYQGRLISPFYHSTCGGRTASPEESFRTVTPVPYLRPVSDDRGAGSYCDISPRFRWTESWDGPTLAGILRRTVPRTLGIRADDLGDIRGVSVRRRGPSGRVLEAGIEVAGGTVPVFGPDIRSVFATPEGQLLRSTVFELRVESGTNGMTRVVAEGGGSGHGVGLCQWGAIGRARDGHSAANIATTYFPGTRIERWY